MTPVTADTLESAILTVSNKDQRSEGGPMAFDDVVATSPYLNLRRRSYMEVMLERRGRGEEDTGEVIVHDFRSDALRDRRTASLSASRGPVPGRDQGQRAMQMPQAMVSPK